MSGVAFEGRHLDKYPAACSRTLCLAPHRRGAVLAEIVIPALFPELLPRETGGYERLEYAQDIIGQIRAGAVIPGSFFPLGYRYGGCHIISPLC